jgi:hypothetical protein
MVPEHVGDVMDSAIGWLLDVTVERNAATLWIKLKQGGILTLVDKSQPSFYILPRNEQADTELFHILSQGGKGNLPILTLTDLKLCFASI